MPIERILEPEVMDSQQEAADYDAMDHREVNHRFVADLITAIQSAPSFAWHSPEPRTPSPQPPAFRPEPPALLDILDLGAGTALIPIELCHQLPNCRVMAADAAVSMLDLARYNVEVHNLTQRIELTHVDAKHLPFADAMFDVVMSNSIIHHIPEPLHVLREASRAVKPGGLLFFRDLLRPDSLDDLNRLVALYTAGANDLQQRMFAESLHAALSLQEIRSLIASLGFAPNSIQQTSDRHWTWSTVLPSPKVL